MKFVNWDKIGIWLSSVCIVHCIVTPALLFIFPFFSFYNSHQIFHWIMLFLVIPLGSFAFIKGYLSHKNIWVLNLGVMGLLLLLVSFFNHNIGPFSGIHTELNHFFLSILGGCFLVAAHITNIRACRSCAQHHHQ